MAMPGAYGARPGYGLTAHERAARGGIGAKITVALMGMVVLFLILGSVGLQALRAADQRTQSLIDQLQLAANTRDDAALKFRCCRSIARGHVPLVTLTSIRVG